MAYERVRDVDKRWTLRGSGYMQFELVPDPKRSRGLGSKLARSLEQNAKAIFTFLNPTPTCSPPTSTATQLHRAIRRSAWEDDAAAAAEEYPSINSCHWLQFARYRSPTYSPPPIQVLHTGPTYRSSTQVLHIGHPDRSYKSSFIFPC